MSKKPGKMKQTKPATSKIKVHCLHDRMELVSKLKPHPVNANKHSTEQIERLAKIIKYQGWRYPIKVSKRSGYITSGHGRLAAAIFLEEKTVPVNFQNYDTDDQEMADVHSDNAIASWAELDLALVNDQLKQLGPDFEIELLGIKDFTLDISEKIGAVELSEESFSHLEHTCPKCGFEFGKKA
jgi:hypothetical protein